MDWSDGRKPGQSADWPFVPGVGGKPGVASRRSVTTLPLLEPGAVSGPLRGFLWPWRRPPPRQRRGRSLPQDGSAPGGNSARGAQAVGKPSVWKSLAAFTRKGYAASVRRQSRQRLRSRARRREKMEICFLRRHVRRRKHFSGRKCGICPLQANKSCARRTASCSKKWQSHFFDSFRGG